MSSNRELQKQINDFKHQIYELEKSIRESWELRGVWQPGSIGACNPSKGILWESKEKP